MSLLFRRQETEYQRKQFNETLDVHGIMVRWYSIDKNHSTAYDFYNDIVNRGSFSLNPKLVKLTYETVPSIKTLQNLGWYVKDEELPYLAYVPVYYVDDKDKESKILTPGIDDMIEIFPNPMDDIMASERYLVKDFVSKGFPNTIYYICKLVPYRENLIETPTEGDYINDEQEQDTDDYINENFYDDIGDNSQESDN